MSKKFKRERRPEIKSVESLGGRKIYALGEGQVFYETDKAYEIWQEKPRLFLVKRLSHKNIGWVNTY